MGPLSEVASLYYRCLQAFCDVVIKSEDAPYAGSNRRPLDQFPAKIISDLMEAVVLRCGGHEERNKHILFTPEVEVGFLFWSPVDFDDLSRCLKMREVLFCGFITHPESVREDMKILLNLTSIGKLRFVPAGSVSFQALNHSVLGRLPNIQSETYNYLNNNILAREFSLGLKLLYFPKELYLSNIPLDVVDIREILLYLPGTRVLRHPLLVAALYTLHKDDDHIPQYNLTNLDLSLEPPLEHTVDDVVKAMYVSLYACPDAEVICMLLMKEKYLEDIFRMLSRQTCIRALRVLTLDNFKPGDYFKRVINTHGRRLRSLTMETYEDMKLGPLLANCHQLECLHLVDRIQKGFTVSDLGSGCNSRLLELRLVSEVESGTSRLGALLLCSTLVMIELHNVQLETTLLNKVTGGSYWNKLECLDVCNCHNFRLCHVMSLLESKPKLKHLSIKRCCNFTDKDHIFLQNYMKTKALDTEYMFAKI